MGARLVRTQRDASRPHMTDALRAKILVGIADSLGAGLVRELAEVRDRKLVEVLKSSRM